jgi:hypothetical protein
VSNDTAAACPQPASATPPPPGCMSKLAKYSVGCPAPVWGRYGACRCSAAPATTDSALALSAPLLADTSRRAESAASAAAALPSRSDSTGTSDALLPASESLLLPRAWSGRTCAASSAPRRSPASRARVDETALFLGGVSSVSASHSKYLMSSSAAQAPGTAAAASAPAPDALGSRQRLTARSATFACTGPCTGLVATLRPIARGECLVHSKVPIRSALQGADAQLDDLTGG